MIKSIKPIKGVQVCLHHGREDVQVPFRWATAMANSSWKRFIILRIKIWTFFWLLKHFITDMVIMTKD
jgi:hypothetical protein